MRANLKLNKILSAKSEDTGSLPNFRNAVNFYHDSYQFQSQGKSKPHQHRRWWCPAHIPSLNFQLLAPAYLPLPFRARNAKEYMVGISPYSWYVNKYPSPSGRVNLQCVVPTGSFSPTRFSPVPTVVDGLIMNILGAAFLSLFHVLPTLLVV